MFEFTLCTQEYVLLTVLIVGFLLGYGLKELALCTCNSIQKSFFSIKIPVDVEQILTEQKEVIVENSINLSKLLQKALTQSLKSESVTAHLKEFVTQAQNVKQWPLNAIEYELHFGDLHTAICSEEASQYYNITATLNALSALVQSVVDYNVTIEEINNKEDHFMNMFNFKLEQPIIKIHK